MFPVLWVYTPLTPCSPAICFWKTGEIRYVHGIIFQLLVKSAVWLNEVTAYHFELHSLFKLQICFCSVVSCPVTFGLLQGIPEIFILPVIFFFFEDHHWKLHFANLLLPCADLAKSYHHCCLLQNHICWWRSWAWLCSCGMLL